MPAMADDIPVLPDPCAAERTRTMKLLRPFMLAAVVATAAGPVRAAAPVAVKVMIVSMFAPEGEVWLRQRRFDRSVAVPGLPSASPSVHCDAVGVCQVTVGMGYANAASSVAALAYSNLFDLRRAYWLIAGIAGIDPAHAALGSVTWARYLVDGGLEWEVDGREKPRDWPSGYLGIGVRHPGDKPGLLYGTEVFTLDPALVRRAVALSKDVKLADSPDARRASSAYGPPADRSPAVIQCDTVSDDTWVSGTDLVGHMAAWTKLLTDGRGDQCTTQQEDNATYAALARATAAGRVDDRRVLVMRTGSDFDHAPSGGNDVGNLLDFEAQGGFGPAIANLYIAGEPVVQNIVDGWASWRNGVPSGRAGE